MSNDSLIWKIEHTVHRRDVNEVLSLKYHMIRYIVRDVQKQGLHSSFPQ